jgi:Outer membrane protein beta-barrel domain
MRRATAVLTLLTLAAVPVVSEASSLDLRMGAFFPRAESNLFRDDAELYLKDGRTLEKGDWVGFAGGAQFNFEVARYAEFGFSIDGYSRTVDTSYRDFVSESDREIFQSLRLTTVPVAVQLRLGPTERGTFSPYVAVGADAIFYRYEEFGDFVDFDTPSHPIIPDSFVSDGLGYGFHVAGGVRVPLTHDFSLNAEAKYQWAKDNMPDDFAGNEIDLGGLTATLGVNLRF